MDYCLPIGKFINKNSPANAKGNTQQRCIFESPVARGRQTTGS